MHQYERFSNNSAVVLPSMPSQAQNVLLQSSQKNACGAVAKISDFGLSYMLDHSETHVSQWNQGGTMTHMAPELLQKGIQSKAADM
jgi:mitogen-activated protein kinase kinase kinase 11